MSSENINNTQNKISHNVCMGVALSGLTDCNKVDVHWSTRDARKKYMFDTTKGVTINNPPT